MAHFFALVLLIFIVMALNILAGIATVLVVERHFPQVSMRIPLIFTMTVGFLLWLFTGHSIFFTLALCFVMGASAALIRNEGPNLKPKRPTKTLRRQRPYKSEDDPNWTDYTKGLKP